MKASNHMNQTELHRHRILYSGLLNTCNTCSGSHDLLDHAGFVCAACVFFVQCEETKLSLRVCEQPRLASV